ncbi:protein FAR1-RELATED SEQUENCE 4-like [Dioscorea cayenensis subsp. rotundata]|uniref:Protein FAR1-RELATED SEQUENCE 4-like n=1 Tax=Dioscorea cayennensis subsp. rotundata TaxID=55577 RepID=A0AB40BTS5_DIOCR|nr:protein FAR1-RELATED SEQUENCE 4-like [Dioscorea cayenensis subsp. rotundata]
MLFDSMDEACDFYNQYAYKKGFSVRKIIIRKSAKDGVNRHLQIVLFGCVLIFDETEYTFIWILENWLQAMKGSHPKVIMTDQDSAISDAVVKLKSCHVPFIDMAYVKSGVWLSVIGDAVYANFVFGWRNM